MASSWGSRCCPSFAWGSGKTSTPQGSERDENHLRATNFNYGAAPLLNMHLAQKPVTRRYSSVFKYIFSFHGTSFQTNMKHILIYSLYCTVVVLIYTVNCDQEDYVSGGRCAMIPTETSENFEVALGLWMIYAAYLFQSYISAALSRFDLTIGAVRSIQGRFNRIMLLICSFAKDTPEADEALRTIKRILSALPYVMFAPPLLGGNPSFLEHANGLLNEEEEINLAKVKLGDMPYALMEWVVKACLAAANEGVFDHQETFVFNVPGPVEEMRGHYGTLVDSLEDAILPFPFVNLTITNVYIIALALPIALFPSIGFLVLPGSIIYYYFVDGMIQFSFIVDRPFTQLSGKPCHSPLVNPHKAIEEITRSIAERFPSGRRKAPFSVRNPIPSKNTLDKSDNHQNSQKDNDVTESITEASSKGSSKDRREAPSVVKFSIQLEEPIIEEGMESEDEARGKLEKQNGED